jgi:hypothetical protein
VPVDGGEEPPGSAHEPARKHAAADVAPDQPEDAEPELAEAPVAPPSLRPDRPGALTDRQLYQLWLRLTLQADAPVIAEWRQVFLEARSLGLTRLGNGNYRPGSGGRRCSGSSGKGSRLRSIGEREVAHRARSRRASTWRRGGLRGTRGSSVGDDAHGAPTWLGGPRRHPRRQCYARADPTA